MAVLRASFFPSTSQPPSTYEYSAAPNWRVPVRVLCTLIVLTQDSVASNWRLLFRVLVFAEYFEYSVEINRFSKSFV